MSELPIYRSQVRECPRKKKKQLGDELGEGPREEGQNIQLNRGGLFASPTN